MESIQHHPAGIASLTLLLTITLITPVSAHENHVTLTDPCFFQSHATFVEYHDLLEDLEERLSSFMNQEEE